MSIELPALPYADDALEPVISKETISYHYGKHHQGYVNKLNKAIAGTAMADMSLEEIIQSNDSGTFNNAAQIWNHSFYWNCMSPIGGGNPSGKLAEAINAQFESIQQFKDQFAKSAGGNFGSGWTWLIVNTDGELEITNTSNADTPAANKAVTALLTVDVWEHAYYIDYRNNRGEYLDKFWQLVNWDFVAHNFES